MIKKKIRIGSRESKLAMIQAEIVSDAIREYDSGIEVEIVKIKTTGDKILNQALDKIGGKGLFVKELEKALLDESIDIAVHSYKDLPMEINPLLPIVALSKREDPRDVLILPENRPTDATVKTIGCSSKRRGVQLTGLYEEIEIKPLRGNVISRIGRLDNGEYDGIVLANAGIKRLGLDSRVTKIFSIDEIMPAASQGILAVQSRKGEDLIYLKNFNDEYSVIVSLAERTFVQALDGGCSSPVAAYAEILGNEMKLIGMFYDEENQTVHKKTITGNKEQAQKLGEELALSFKE